MLFNNNVRCATRLLIILKRECLKIDSKENVQLECWIGLPQLFFPFFFLDSLSFAEYEEKPAFWATA